MQDQSENQSFEESFRASLRQQPTPIPQQNAPKTRPKWLLPLIAGITAIIVLIVVPVVIIIASKTSGSDFEEYVQTADEKIHSANVYDQNTLTGNLNEEFATAANKGAHADYKSIATTTRYLDDKPEEVCETFHISCSSLAAPKNLNNASKIETLNANALNYYLDMDRIVTMTFHSKSQGGNTTTTYAIFAADYEVGFYYVFVPSGKTITKMSMNQSDLFDDVQGIPDFYAISPSGRF